MLSSSGNSCTAVVHNLQREPENWGQLANILGREGSDMRTAGNFYVVVVQVVLLFKSDTWLLTPGCRNPSRVSTTGWCGGCREWDPNINGMVHRYIHPLGWHWKWWVWRRLGFILPATITRSQNKLQLLLSCTCVWRRSGSCDCVYPGNSGSRPIWIS